MAGGSALDDVRQALYVGPRATFVERRKELARTLRSGGDRDGAKIIAELRKPTAAAHLVNLLAQADDSSLRELVELGASIRAAMAMGDDGEMRSLLQGRTAAIANTVARAREVARTNDESVSAVVGDQIVQTLRAAMASDEAAAAVRSGTLTDALDEPGFEGFTVEPAARTAGNPKRGTAPSADAADGDLARAAEVARARIEAAAADVARTEKALAAATERRDALGRERDRLASQLAQVDERLTAANREVDDAQLLLDEAGGTLTAAAEASSD